MSRPESEEFQLYFNRIRPIYHQLFNLAHAVSGSSEHAEYCLQYAMLDCWSAGEATASSHGFRESLRSNTVRIALKTAADAPADWDGLRSGAESSDPLLRAIAQEGTELRRILALKYGCGLSARRIARAMDLDLNRVQTLLRRFEARTRRRLSGADSRKYDLLLVRTVRSQLNLPSPQAPEMGALFRSFQADAESVVRPNRLPARILHAVLALILALLCMGAFWLAAVLMQPAVLEDPGNTPAIETPAE